MSIRKEFKAIAIPVTTAAALVGQTQQKGWHNTNTQANLAFWGMIGSLALYLRRSRIPWIIRPLAYFYVLFASCESLLWAIEGKPIDDTDPQPQATLPSQNARK